MLLSQLAWFLLGFHWHCLQRAGERMERKRRNKLHRHRPQIAFPKKLGDTWMAMKGEAGGGGHRNQHWETNERLWRVTNEGKQSGTASQNGDHEGDKWGRQDGSGSREQRRMEIMKGDKWRETRRQGQPRAAQNGDHAGRQMKGGKAAAKSKPEWRLCRETNEGRQGGRGSQEQPRMCREQPRIAQNRDQEGTQMKGDKAAAAAKSGPEWRSCRETNEGRQSGSQEQARMEIMQGDKWRETRRQGRPRAAQNAQGDKWRETRRQRQPRIAQNGDQEGTQMKGDKAAAASRPFGDCGDQQPSLWEVRTPIASSYLGKKELKTKQQTQNKQTTNSKKEEIQEMKMTVASKRKVRC